MKEVVILLTFLFTTKYIYAGSEKMDCQERAIKSADAIESLYGETKHYKYKAEKVSELGTQSKEGNHEVTGGVIYKVEVDYRGKTFGIYFVSISKTFPDFECVVSNVQYLGNILRTESKYLAPVIK